MKHVTIGKLFWRDCIDCDCDVPPAIKQTAKTVTVDADDPRIGELISRSWLYVDPYGPGNDCQALKAAAKRTLKSLGELK